MKLQVPQRSRTRAHCSSDLGSVYPHRSTFSRGVRFLAAGWGAQHVGEQHHSRPRLGKAPCKHFMGC